MNKYTTVKKAALKDWHPADIVAALRKAGWSIRKLSLHHGYAQATTLSKAIERPWPKGERLIAEAIGIDPATIWPARYAGRDDTTGGQKRHVRSGKEKAA